MYSVMTLRIATLVALLSSAFAVSMSAQLQHSTITGTIVGPNNSAIGQAKVTLFDQLGNAVTSVAATNGEFRIPDVPTGSYSLRAEAPPFQANVQTLTVVDAL